MSCIKYLVSFRRRRVLYSQMHTILRQEGPTVQRSTRRIYHANEGCPCQDTQHDVIDASSSLENPNLSSYMSKWNESQATLAQGNKASPDMLQAEIVG